MFVKCDYKSDGLFHRMAEVVIPQADVRNDEDFVIDTGSPRSFLSRKRAGCLGVNLDELPNGQKYMGRITKKLLNVKIKLKYNGSEKSLETELLILPHDILRDNILGLDLIFRFGKLHVSAQQAWLDL